MDGWINKINLKVPSFKQPQPEPAEAEEKPVEQAEGQEGAEGEAEQQEKPLPPDSDLPEPPALKAIVRVRIPLVRE